MILETKLFADLEKDAMSQQPQIETRICRERDGWRIEARISVAKDVYHWRVQGWTSGTKADALRSEREIRAELMKASTKQ